MSQVRSFIFSLVADSLASQDGELSSLLPTTGLSRREDLSLAVPSAGKGIVLFLVL